jgi:FlaA1/EpsC-like NDP-sugar epimerase
LKAALERGKVDLVVADIRDEDRIRVVLNRYQPEIIFHAAAHKHVPLMEENLEDAVTNNVLGTKSLVSQASEAGVERFVLISTDKAVEPVNIMGMTKKVAEFLVKQAAEAAGKPYVSVRFGNVLGSRGSVVPLFQEQIEKGGPVTITHPEVERYFMTIHEAAQLVLQAASLGVNGEIFVLDMGEQIRIEALARDLIELSGLTVDQDITIHYSGLRPGEKLSEKLIADHEKVEPTLLQSILRIQGGDQPAWEEFDKSVSRLIDLAERGERAETLELLVRMTN